MAEHGLRKTRACRAIGLSRSAHYNEPQGEDDQPVIDALNKLVDANPRWGFWLSYERLRLDGRWWNHKRVYRVYKAIGLDLARLKKKRVPVSDMHPLEAPAAPNRFWSPDFMSDALYGDQRFRTLNILDGGVREVRDIVIDTSLPSGRVVRTLEQLKSRRGVPVVLRVDTGPELISQALIDWCNHVELRHIQPGKPNQNAFIERFNKTYRNEVLDAYLFHNPSDVRQTTTS